jgi:hypothetical protein
VVAILGTSKRGAGYDILGHVKLEVADQQENAAHIALVDVNLLEL